MLSLHHSFRLIRFWTLQVSNSSNFRNDCGFEIQEIAKSASKKFNGRHQTVGIIIILSLCHTKQNKKKIISFVVKFAVGLYFCCCFLESVCSCYCWFVFFFISFSISFFIWKLNYPKRTCSTKWITCSSYRCWEEFLKLIV